MISTSPRNKGFHGIPLWRSTDGGVTFASPTNVLNVITNSDKPWITVDNSEGTGKHDVYVACTGYHSTIATTNLGVWVTVSTNGSGTDWSEPFAVRKYDPPEVISVSGILLLAGSDHRAFAFWNEGDGSTKWIKMRQILNRGMTTGAVHTVAELVSSYEYPLKLSRSNTAPTNDFFTAPTPLPVPAVDPVKTNSLYVTYADKGTNAADKSDIFFVRSPDGGETWTNLVRLNTDSTTNDQWMPAITIKPDGEQLLVSWYDRRNDTSNSLIDVYGRFGSVSSNGFVEFQPEFRITTTNCPPVFSGVTQTNIGDYDPVWPPVDVTLDWWYTNDWPLLVPGTEVFQPTLRTWRGHVGEYNGAWADGFHAYLTWTDYRLLSSGTVKQRNQPDIRLLKITWPD